MRFGTFEPSRNYLLTSAKFSLLAALLASAGSSVAMGQQGPPPGYQGASFSGLPPYGQAESPPNQFPQGNQAQPDYYTEGPASDSSQEQPATEQSYVNTETNQPGATAAPASSGYVVGSDKSMTTKWTNDGAVAQSKNNDFKYHVRGVSQLDFIGQQIPSGGVIVPGGAGTKDYVGFRRLRFGAEGTMYETIDWVFEFDFAFALQNVDPSAGATPALGLRSIGGLNQAGNTIAPIQPTTINMVFKEIPLLGNIRVGNQQSWISLEHIESARFLDFMERSSLMDAFNGANNNGYAPGISIYNMTENKKAALALGAYKNNVYDSGYPYDIGNGNFTYGGRGTWTPYYDEPTEGRYLVHLGFGGEYRVFDQQPLANTDGTNVRIRTRGDLRNTSSTLDPNYTDTGNFYAESQTVLCPEAVVQWGSLLLQAEWEKAYMGGAAARKGGTGLGNVNFQGGYVEALYFLTGENRAYNRQQGVFGRVVPIENAHFTRGVGMVGKGAWQVGLRYDWMNLNSGLVQGGDVQNMTLGLNWFLNPNARFQFNYIYTNFDNAALVPAGFLGTVGSLSGARFAGTGAQNSLGMRMDFNF